MAAIGTADAIGTATCGGLGGGVLLRGGIASSGTAEDGATTSATTKHSAIGMGGGVSGFRYHVM